jgi:hypothetical protein
MRALRLRHVYDEDEGSRDELLGSARIAQAPFAGRTPTGEFIALRCDLVDAC